MGDIVLAAGLLRVVLRPAWGGRVIELTHRRAGALLRPVVARRFAPENWPRAGAYPLIPFHNRIEGATFTFAGRTARLAPHRDSMPHALHGMASRMAWRGRLLSPGRALMTLHHARSRAWPWRFVARQEMHLDPGGLTVALSLRNLDDGPMPGGLGWHPYFPSPVRIRDDARQAWPVRADYLPGAGPTARGVAAGPTQYLAEWRRVRIALRRGAVLRLERPRGLSHLVVHAPPGAFACVEPVSHLANALALPDRPGIVALAPGSAMTARFRLDIRG